MGRGQTYRHLPIFHPDGKSDERWLNPGRRRRERDAVLEKPGAIHGGNGAPVGQVGLKPPQLAQSEGGLGLAQALFVVDGRRPANDQRGVGRASGWRPMRS